MRKLTHEEILSLRLQNNAKPRNPISICVNDVRSLYNVGSIFRVADGIRAEKVYLCGISGKPPDRAITKTALGAEDSVPWEYHRDITLLLGQLRLGNYQIVALEHTTSCLAYTDFKPEFPICLVVGNEVCGVDSELMTQIDQAIEIPMMGEKNSLNVAVATGIIGYHWMHGWHASREVSPITREVA